MQSHSFPFAVRLIGFPEEEAKAIADSFGGDFSTYGYFRLDEDNLQDPDLYLVNADELKALVTLSDLAPGMARPALLVGVPTVTLPLASLIAQFPHQLGADSTAYIGGGPVLALAGEFDQPRRQI